MEESKLYKTCSKCGETKAIDDFCKNKNGRYGVHSVCKSCQNAIGRKKYQENREASWARTNAYNLENYERVKEAARIWREKNRAKRRAYSRKNYNKYRNEPKVRLNSIMSNAIFRSLRGAKEGRHWESLVGYTLNQLKKHLEKQFIGGMSWENYGEWHVDHIVPKSAFNFANPEDIDFKRCWALKNLRPLWATDNLKKHAKLNKPFQPSLIL